MKKGIVRKEKKGAATLVALLVLLCLLFTGCGKQGDGGSGDGSADSGGGSGKDVTQAEGEEFSVIPPYSVFDVEWHTEGESFMAGTASCIETDYSDEPLLITAFHYFVPEEGNFSGRDLQSLIKGGDLYDLLEEDASGVTVRENILLEDAAPLPDVEHDLAAFYMDNRDKVNTFRLSDTPCKKGDKVYLLAALWNSEHFNENCIYPATVTEDETSAVLSYWLDSKYNTAGASGAPVVNEDGEIVAIHLGSDGPDRVGHTAASIDNMLRQALEN